MKKCSLCGLPLWPHLAPRNAKCQWGDNYWGDKEEFKIADPPKKNPYYHEDFTDGFLKGKENV